MRKLTVPTPNLQFYAPNEKSSKVKPGKTLLFSLGELQTKSNNSILNINIYFINDTCITILISYCSLSF